MINVKQILKKIIHDCQFNKHPLAVILNPFYLDRAGISKNVKEMAISLSGSLLDVGCGTKPYKDFFSCSKYVGLEIKSDNNSSCEADFFYDGKTFPFGNAEFDTVFSSQVLEHVFEPDLLFEEIFRVMKPGGKLLLTVPFAWNEHECPYDYARYTSFGLKYLLSKHGFQIIEQRKIALGVTAQCQLINALIFEYINGTNPFTYILRTILTAPINITGLIAERIIPECDKFYLDNIILAEKVNQ